MPDTLLKKYASKEIIKMQSKRIKIIVFLFSAVIITCGALYLKRNNTNEREFLRFNIGSENKTVTVDIAQQCFLKYYLQPGVISAYCRGRNREFIEPLYARFSGIDSYVSQGSKKRKWKELQPGDELQKRENGDMPVNIEFAIPYNTTRQYSVGRGVLEIYTAEKTVNTIIFNFINSKYK